ncbi:hypothetical protein [Pontibacter actiniarum]|uniref:Uncharacterized protein n=1 Tax=Pontibacter actiniarum TaxID=323450 RepID=A0A1X9YUM8_9BACT|nr:hypothetical protein [Pontibacter actiniarum]ARS36553.1 hypothetical protein CA264_14580 [Pontibacter actiniarum]
MLRKKNGSNRGRVPLGAKRNAHHRAELADFRAVITAETFRSGYFNKADQLQKSDSHTVPIAQHGNGNSLTTLQPNTGSC